MDLFLKRKTDENDKMDVKKARLECCPHANKCYRRNPHHFLQFDHPHLNSILKEGKPYQVPAEFPQDEKVLFEQLEILEGLKRPNKDRETSSSSTSTSKSVSVSSTSQSSKQNVPNTGKKTMAERLQDNAPYNLFFTIIPDSTNTAGHKNSITFTDLLCPSLGNLKCSLQINFMIDIAWLIEQYLKMGQNKKPLTILYGDEFPDMKKYIEIMLPNVTEHHVKMRDPFGTHHSKVGIYVYDDNSLRVVVSTANLYFEDWNYYCQGLWLSPLCSELSTDSPDTAGESPTNFKSSLLNYLKEYKLPVLQSWINYVKRADFSAVKVFLVTSAPGKYTSTSQPNHCHLHTVGRLLSNHCLLPAKITPTTEGPLSWGINAQASSIGTLGKTPADWLRGTLLRSLASHKDCRLPASSNATLNVVYPTGENVLGSYYGPNGGGCLPYSKAVNEKQKWLKDYLHCWKADNLSRSRAMPHIKTYCRVSPCLTKLAWFLITSSNLSKSAWGSNINKAGSSYVRSYEVGVMFLPKFFDEDYFTIKSEENKKIFPFIYDLPLTPYKKDDEPWCN